MKVITAKELKNRTGEALRYVAKGGRVLITRRGKPLALLSPTGKVMEDANRNLRSFQEAWADIDAQLKATKPPFPNWQEAIRWSRRRG